MLCLKRNRKGCDWHGMPAIKSEARELKQVSLKFGQEKVCVEDDWSWVRQIIANAASILHYCILFSVGKLPFD